MIITEKVTIKIPNKVITHYKNLGYNINQNIEFECLVEHLTKNSKTIIDVICDICNKEKSTSYESYNKSFDILLNKK